MNRRSFLTALVALPATQTTLPAQAARVDPQERAADALPPGFAYTSGYTVEFTVDGRRYRVPVFE